MAEPSRVFPVSELLRIVNLELAMRWSDVAVEGEVTNCTRSSAGHIYFTIKDEKAQLQVVLFATQARSVRFRLDHGLQVVVHGKLAVYAQRGSFQLTATTVEPKGLGALQLAFEQLKEQLEREGLFAAERKRPIPMLPQRIAIVTSPQGAAIRDILHVLGRRFEGLSLQIFPVRVQGAEAAGEIAAALRHLSRWASHDVVILTRGGGSLEDLWPFNEEIVARALAECSIPTISGVGHETDFTIADFVADLRAPTPSAAAEIVVQAKEEIYLRIDHAVRRIHHVIESRLVRIRHDLRDLSSSDRLRALPHRIAALRSRLEKRRVELYRFLEADARRMRERLESLRQPLQAFPATLRLESRFRDVVELREQAHRALHGRLERERHQLRSLAATLEAVSPLSVLARGYAIAFRDGRRKKVLQDPNEVEIGDPIHVQLRAGSLDCTVDGKTLGLESISPSIEEHVRPGKGKRGSRRARPAGDQGVLDLDP